MAPLRSLGGNMGKIKGTRAGLQILDSSGTTIHKLYNTNIVKIEHTDTGYINIVLNSGGYRTNHTKNCMNDVLSQFDIKVFQKNFKWFFSIDNGNVTWDFEDGMNLGINNDVVVRGGLTSDIKRNAQ